MIKRKRATFKLLSVQSHIGALFQSRVSLGNILELKKLVLLALPIKISLLPVSACQSTVSSSALGFSGLQRQEFSSKILLLHPLPLVSVAAKPVAIARDMQMFPFLKKWKEGKKEAVRAAEDQMAKQGASCMCLSASQCHQAES